MASVTLQLANPQCGGVTHVVGSKLGRLKVSSVSSQPQPSLISFKRISTWNLKNPDNHWAMNAFGLDTKRKTSQHATTYVIRNMSSGDTQNNDDNILFSEVKLIDAKCLVTVGKNLLIRYNNGKEMKVEYTDPSRQSTSKINAELGDSSTPCLFLQSTSETARILALPHPEHTVNLFLDKAKLNQYLKTEFIKENEDFNYTGVWLSRGEKREYKLTFKVCLKKAKVEFKFDMSIRALQLALVYNIPIHVHRDVLHEDGLQFLTTTSEMELFNEAFKLLLVDMRHRIAVAEERFLDAEFWETAGLSCDIDTILMGPRMGLI